MVIKSSHNASFKYGHKALTPPHIAPKYGYKDKSVKPGPNKLLHLRAVKFTHYVHSRMYTLLYVSESTSGLVQNDGSTEGQSKSSKRNLIVTKCLTLQSPDSRVQ